MRDITTTFAHRRRFALAAAAVLAVLCLAAAAGFARSANAGSSDLPTGVAALAAGSPVAADEGATQLADTARGVQAANVKANASVLGPGDPLVDQLRILRTGLGSNSLSIEGFPTSNGFTCFNIVNGPGMCFPVATRDSGMAWTIHGLYGSIIYGVARDDVASVDVEVNGAWESASLANNTFFYELPAGESMYDITAIRSTFTDGSQHVEQTFGR